MLACRFARARWFVISRRLRCGLEFVGLSAEQREMIRYWVHRSAPQPIDIDSSKDLEKEDLKAEDFRKDDNQGLQLHRQKRLRSP